MTKLLVHLLALPRNKCYGSNRHSKVLLHRSAHTEQNSYQEISSSKQNDEQAIVLNCLTIKLLYSLHIILR